MTDSRAYTGVSAAPSNSFTERNISYDLNGNILTLDRYAESEATPEESAVFSYIGNHIWSVSEGRAFGYDHNGNMTLDGRNGLRLTYNRLNLVGEIGDASGTLAKYTHLANGTKVSAERPDGSGVLYQGSLVYSKDGDGNLSLDRVLADGGHFVAERDSTGIVTGYRFFHHLTDHLGSVRAVIDSDTGTVIGTSDYYPFGKRIPLPVTEPVEVTTSPNRWHFSGKESQSFLSASIPLLDFGARMYDPLTARWTAQDPLAEKYYAVSPYAYCLGNPVANIDAQGDSVRVYIETIGIGHTWISAGEGDNMVLYTYGRYDHTYKGNQLSDGPGVLVRLSGDKAKEYNDEKQTKGKMSVFTLPDVNDNDIMNIANEVFYSSERLPSEKSKRYANDPTAHIIDEYNLLNNNCTTFVSDLINKAGSKVLNYQHIISVSPIGIPITIPSTHRFVNPRSMKSYLQRQIKK